MKKLSLFALSALVGTGVMLGTSPQLPVAAATPASATLLVAGTAGSAANSGVGDSGGLAWGVDTTLVGSKRWTVFESSASNLVDNDTNNASDIFVTDGTIITRLSVSAIGVQGDTLANSYDPTICGSGRKVAFTTENEWDTLIDGNGYEDVYVIDRDADADGIMDEFSQVVNALATPPVLSAGVTTSVVSVSYDTNLEDYAISFEGGNSGVISDDCSKVAFVTNEGFNADDFNYTLDVYVRDLSSSTAPLTWMSKYATNGSSGGGFLPAISEDGAVVVVSTEATDLVSATGTVGGLVLREVEVGTYLTRTPAGAASLSALPDTERPSAITPDGKCVAFKADRGYDLLSGNTGAVQGIYLWDNRTGTPVITLVSIAPDGIAATSAANPRISDDCRFVAYQSSDEFLSSADNNRKVDVFLYDTVQRTTDLISTNAAGLSSDGDSSVAALDWDETTGEGVVLIMSSATNIGGAAGGSSVIDLFSVPFADEVAPTIPTPPTPPTPTTPTTPKSSFISLSEPKRLVDTRGGDRFGTTSVSKVSVKRVKIAGATTFDSKATGLPVSGIGAVALNVTAVEGFDDGGYGFVTAYPCDSLTTAVPNSSNLNFAGGETIPNAVIAPVSADGFVCFSVYGNTDLLVDASGYFPSGSGFSALSEPKRLVDTRGGDRFGTTSVSKVSVKRVKIAGATTFDSKATGLPVSGIGAVALNVTAVEGSDDGGYGFVTAYPCDSLTTAVPNSSNLNFAGGETIPNAVIAPVSADGHVCFSVYGNTDLLVDASGYFSRVS